MKVDITTESTYHQINIEGRIDATNVGDFENEVLPFAQDSTLNLLINFQEVNYISSAGLRAILKIAKITQAKKIKLVCANLQPAVLDVFKISGFSSILHCYSNFDEAIAYING